MTNLSNTRPIMSTTPSNRLVFLLWLRMPFAAPVAAVIIAAALPAGAAAQAIELQNIEVRVSPGPAGLPSEAAKIAPRLDIRLEQSSIQALPNEITNVVVAPDGRVWFQLRIEPFYNGRVNGKDAPTLPLIKEEIAAEFTQSSPQVRDCTLCLIEPGGRAWYWVARHATLLGYDGKTWIDYVIPAVSEGQTAFCRTRGALADGRCNLWAGSAAWFVIGNSVYRFDGASWSRQRVARSSAPGRIVFPAGYAGPVYNRSLASPPVFLAVSPDGRVAAAAEQHGPIWICRGGKWECREDLIKPSAAGSREADPFAAPDGDANGRDLVASLVLSDNANLWCLLRSGRFLHVALEPQAKAAAVEANGDVQKYIDELAANDYATRERASTFLAGKGSAIRQQLQSARTASSDAEQRARLKRLLDKLEDSPASGSLQSFGSVRLGQVQALACDDAGRVFAFAQSIDNGRGQPGSGLAVLSPGGATKTILVDQQFGGPTLDADGLPLIIGSSGQRLLAPAEGLSGPLRLFHLGTGQAVDPFANIQVFGLSAIDGQGHVFARRNASRNATPILVLKKEL